MEYATEIGRDVGRAVDLLKKSELVAVPTQTVYGLAGNALDEEAIAKIFQVKNRPSFDPLITHIASIDWLETLCKDIPDEAYQVAQAFWPGPLTMTLPRKNHIPDILCSGLPAMAIRMPSHNLFRELLGLLCFPLAAPSANPFTYISPTSSQHVLDQLGGKIPYILDGGACEIGIESTIIHFEKGEVILLREGAIDQESLQKVLGKPLIIPKKNIKIAPGAHKKHYAPNKKVIIGDIAQLIPKFDQDDIGIISFQKQYVPDGRLPQEVLSPSGDLKEAAKNLFKALRTIDNASVSTILMEYVPNYGIGRAINERIRKAGEIE